MRIIVNGKPCLATVECYLNDRKSRGKNSFTDTFQSNNAISNGNEMLENMNCYTQCEGRKRDRKLQVQVLTRQQAWCLDSQLRNEVINKSNVNSNHTNPDITSTISKSFNTEDNGKMLDTVIQPNPAICPNISVMNEKHVYPHRRPEKSKRMPRFQLREGGKNASNQFIGCFGCNSVPIKSLECFHAYQKPRLKSIPHIQESSLDLHFSKGSSSRRFSIPSRKENKSGPKFQVNSSTIISSNLNNRISFSSDQVIHHRDDEHILPVLEKDKLSNSNSVITMKSLSLPIPAPKLEPINWNVQNNDRKRDQIDYVKLTKSGEPILSKNVLEFRELLQEVSMNNTRSINVDDNSHSISNYYPVECDYGTTTEDFFRFENCLTEFSSTSQLDNFPLCMAGQLIDQSILETHETPEHVLDYPISDRSSVYAPVIDISEYQL